MLPFNPTDRPGVSPMGSFNAAISFVTNTNWQWYSGELSISNLTNMLGNTVQNFVSAAAGMVVVVALIRGITRTGSRLLGNFWVDLVRTLLRILLPLSLVFAVVLISQGVIQNLGDGVVAVTVDQTPLDAGDPATAITEQAIPGGPLASQEAIKELGTNGGGFFNANSAHPFSNPNGITNILADLGAAADPVLDGRRLRPAREGQEPGPGAHRGDGDDPDRVQRASPCSPNRTATRTSPPRAPTSRCRSPSRAATWRARRCASAHPAAACSPAPRPARRPAR